MSVSRIRCCDGPPGAGQALRGDPGRRRRAVLGAAVTLFLVVVPAVLAGSSAWATSSSDDSSAGSTPSPTPLSSAPATGSSSSRPSPSPTASASPSAESVEVDVTAPPSPLSLPLEIRGSRSSGAEVQVQPDDGSGEPLCIAPASTQTSWSCEVDALPSGPNVPLRVVAIGPDGRTAVDSLTVAWLNPPTLTGAGRPTTAGQVGGTGYPGANVTATVAATGGTCTATVDASGGWTCVLSEPLPSGTYTVTAVQRADFLTAASAASAPAVIEIDKDPPGMPSLLSPTAGARLPLSGGVFSGRGESGNSVILFAGVRPLCQAEVVDDAWSCHATAVPAGTYDVTAMQLDRAGNASAASPAVSITFSEAVTAAPLAPSTTPPSTTPPTSGSGSGSGSTTPGTTSPAPDGAAPPSAATPSPTSGPEWIESLRSPTRLGTSLAPLTTVAASQVVTAAGLGLGTVALIIVPVLAAHRALMARLRRLPSLTGRNRGTGDAPRLHGPGLGRWTRAVLVTVAAAGFLTLSMPVAGRSSSIRLALATAAAVALLNLATTVAVVRVARSAFDVPVVTVTRLPLLALTALTALVSRLFGLVPPLVSGQILGTRFAAGATETQRSATSLAQILVAAGLSVLGWAGSSLVPAQTDPVLLFAHEASTLLTLTAAASAAIGVLPRAELPGAAVLKRSRTLWLVTAMLTWSLLFLVLTAVTPDDTASALASLVAVALGLSAVSASAWLWSRYVEPWLRAA